ncbi:MAG: GNAT family N-acetyltransferase [Candidatus Sericytochromatia bacterium]
MSPDVPPWPPAPTTVREATPAETAEVLAHTRPLWGGGHDLATYARRTDALLETPWGRGHYRFVVGLDATGAIVTACKRYRLALRLNGEPVRAVGFGAVFTPESHRARGHAAALLRAVMAEEAARGAHVALLYSDIGPAYYERLGFRAIRCEVGEAPASGGARSGFVPLGDRDPASLLTWHRAPDARLSFEPSADYWAFKLARHRPELVLYAPDGVPVGFAAVHAEPEGLWVDEAGFDAAIAPSAFWHALRALAAERGLPVVRGWLPHEAADAGYAFAPLTTNAPMAAPLAWVMLLGVSGGATISLALSLIVLRARDDHQVASLSGMAQGLGYLMAASGPFVFGWLYDRTHRWEASLGLLVACALFMSVAAYGASRPGCAGQPPAADGT